MERTMTTHVTKIKKDDNKRMLCTIFGNMFENLDDMDKIPGKYNPSKLTKKKSRLDSPKIVQRIEHQ